MPLVWAGLWRRPVRSILTASSIVIAFVLLGLLQGVNAGFDRAIAAANRNFLVTGTRVRGGANMPISAMTKIRSYARRDERGAARVFHGGRQSQQRRTTLPRSLPSRTCSSACCTRQRSTKKIWTPCAGPAPGCWPTPELLQSVQMESRRYGHRSFPHAADGRQSGLDLQYRRHIHHAAGSLLRRDQLRLLRFQPSDGPQHRRTVLRARSRIRPGPLPRRRPSTASSPIQGTSRAPGRSRNARKPAPNRWVT